MHTDILIVGGGLSGLALADKLQQAGRDFLLVKARDRLGGRIDVLRDGGSAFDLGPSWFWPGQPRMDTLTRRLGLTVFSQHAAGNLSYEDENGAVQRGVGYASMEGSYRIEGGMMALVTALASQIAPARLKLDAPVVEIDQAGTVTFANGDTITAGQIVLAVPPRVIATIKITPDFDAAVRQSLINIPTWMGGQAKFVATYARPFWRDEGLSGDAMSRHGPMVEIHDASAMDGSPGALFGFIGVPAAQRDGQSDALRAASIAQLGRLFGPEALKPQKTELRDWAYAPQTASALDHQALGGHPRYGLPSALRNLWQGKLIMGSTEIASQFGGFLEGALTAAEDVVMRLET